MSTKKTIDETSSEFIKFNQKFRYIAEGVLFNIAEDCYGDDPDETVDWALAAARHYMLTSDDAVKETFIEINKEEAE